MIPTVILTAPRPESYLNRTAASLTAAGFEIHGIRRDRTHSGSCGNFRRALRDLCRQRPDGEAYAIFEDDVLVARGLKQWLDFNRPEGVASLYCPSFYAQGESGWQQVRLTPQTMQQAEASCALIFSRDCAERFVEQSTWQRPTGTGFAVGRWCIETGTPYWQFRPSLVSHIGVQSAIDGRGFSERRREMEFCRDVEQLT